MFVGLDYEEYLGIPYAAPPVGELRWMKPEPPEAWEGVKNVTEFGSRCVQIYYSYNTTSEDCLFLNVYVPGRSFAHCLINRNQLIMINTL